MALAEQTIEAMAYVTGLARFNPSRFLLLIFLLQSAYLLSLFYRAPQQARVQHATTEKHTTAVPILSGNASIQDFGRMGKKVQTLAT